MSLKNRLLRYWTYFRRGHNVYLVFLLSFSNFIVIQYRLLIEYLPSLSGFFGDLAVFAVAFLVLYIPAAVLIGWYDYRKLAVPVDTTILARASPWRRDLAKALIYLAEGKNEEARKVLLRWTKAL